MSLSNIVELRLPLKSSKGKRDANKVTIGGAGGVIFASKPLLSREVKTVYHGIIRLQRHIEIRDEIVTLNLLAVSLMENKVVALTCPQTYEGITYPPHRIRFKIAKDFKDWKKLYYKVAGKRPGEKTLSLYINLDKINSSNLRVVEPKGTWVDDFSDETNIKDKTILEITIYPGCFEIKKEVYWLPEVGQPLKVIDYEDPDKNFGICGNTELYPVAEQRIKRLSKEDSAKSMYSVDTLEHQRGDASVERIMLALEKLEGVTSWKTGENSIADINYKWDLIINVKNKYYPIQVKSSEHHALEHWKKYKQAWKNSDEIPFVPVIIWTNLNSSLDKLAGFFSELFNVPIRSENSCLSFSPVQDEPQLPKSIDEIRTGKKAHRPIVEALMDTAKRGEWNKEAEDLLQAIVDRDENKHYKLAKHCRVLIDARTQQLKFLEKY